MRLEGVIPPIVTPFNPDTTINYETFRHIIHYFLKAGVHGIFVSGGTGEYTVLSLQEREELFKIAVGTVDGQVPILAGVGCPSIAESVRLAKAAAKCGVTATVATNPHYPLPSEREIYNYHRVISKTTSIPHIVYNLPKYGVDMSVEMVKRLSEENYIQGIKDSHKELWHTIDIIRSTTDDFTVLTGYAKYFLPTLLMGGQGTINVISNLVPRTLVSIYEAFKIGTLDNARSLQMKIYPLADVVFSLGPYIPVVKEALRLVGRDVGDARRPALPLDDQQKKRLKKVLQSLDIPEIAPESAFVK